MASDSFVPFLLFAPIHRLIGTDTEGAFLQVEGQAEKRDVADVQSLAHALRNDSQDETQLTVRHGRQSHVPPRSTLCLVEEHFTAKSYTPSSVLFLLF